MSASYSAYPVGFRYPFLAGFKYFIASQLPMLVCALLALGAIWLVVSGRISKNGAVLLIPCFAFVIYSLSYYKEFWHYYYGSWLLVLPAAAALERLPMNGRAIIAVLLLPGLYSALRLDLARPRSLDVQATVLPNGEKLWLTPEVIQRNQSMLARLKTLPDGPSRTGVLFLGRTPIVWASHFHYFYQIPEPARLTMIYPGWLRPRDFQLLPFALDRSKAVVLLQNPDQGPPARDACQWETHPYPRPYCEELSARLEEPIKIDDTCWIFPLSYH